MVPIVWDMVQICHLSLLRTPAAIGIVVPPPALVNFPYKFCPSVNISYLVISPKNTKFTTIFHNHGLALDLVARVSIQRFGAR